MDEVFLCFNGGKDCTVLLDITINVLKDIYKSCDIGKNLKVVYIRTKGPFVEIEKFVQEIKMYYGLTLKVTEGEMKETLQRLLEKDGILKAGLMGTRRSDPYSENLQFVQVRVLWITCLFYPGDEARQSRRRPKYISGRNTRIHSR